MARIRRGRYQVHHILFRILVVVGIAKDHIEELVQTFHILLAVLQSLLVQEVDNHSVRDLVDIQRPELVLDMVPIERIIFLQGRIGSGGLALTLDELLVDGVKRDFLVLHIVTGVVQMIQYILHGFGGFAFALKAAFFDLSALVVYKAQINTV